MKGGGELNTKIAYHCHWWNIIFNTAAFVWHYHYHMFICPMDSDSGGEKRLISVRARGGEIKPDMEQMGSPYTCISCVRYVFKAFYQQGLTWEKIAEKTGYSQSPDYPRLYIRDTYLKKCEIK